MSALLLAVSLSMDALGIGVSYGLRGIKTSLGAKIVICLVSVMFTAAALFSGISCFCLYPKRLRRHSAR